MHISLLIDAGFKADNLVKFLRTKLLVSAEETEFE